ncbi:MAG: hypothetical protein AAF170_09870 [Bacteroidota bacterium]
MLALLFAIGLLGSWGGCDTTDVSPPDASSEGLSRSDERTTPIVQERLMSRVYGMGGGPMRRGLVPFGDRVLVVARPNDDKTPQHIVAVDAQGTAVYLNVDGAFVPVPNGGAALDRPATLRGEGIEADYADGLLALLNSDSLSDWTDSGFLDWGAGMTPQGAPTEWSTRVPLVWRESHQRTVAALGPDTGQSETLLVGYVGRLYRDAQGRQPVQFPSAMISLDRGRSWCWSPEIDGARPPVGAYAAAWPNAPGGGVVLYFVTTLPGDDETAPLVVFGRDASSPTGVAMTVPYASRTELWPNHVYESFGRSFVPSPIRHWVTRWGLMMETITQGLFWMESPDSLPQPIGDVKQTMDAPNRTLYFAANNEMMRIQPSGDVERLDNPVGAVWNRVGYVERAPDTRWLQAAANDDGTVWLLGSTQSPWDVTIATWPSGTAYSDPGD